MSLSKRSFSSEFKSELVRQLTSGEKRLSQLCREHSLCASLLRRWRKQFEEQGDAAWPTPVVALDAEHRVQELQARVRALEISLGRAHLENEFLREALSKKGSLPPRSGR